MANLTISSDTTTASPAADKRAMYVPGQSSTGNTMANLDPRNDTADTIVNSEKATADANTDKHALVKPAQPVVNDKEATVKQPSIEKKLIPVLKAHIDISALGTAFACDGNGAYQITIADNLKAGKNRKDSTSVSVQNSMQIRWDDNKSGVTIHLPSLVAAIPELRKLVVECKYILPCVHEGKSRPDSDYHHALEVLATGFTYTPSSDNSCGLATKRAPKTVKDFLGPVFNLDSHFQHTAINMDSKPAALLAAIAKAQTEKLRSTNLSWKDLVVMGLALQVVGFVLLCVVAVIGDFMKEVVSGGRDCDV